MRPPRPVGARRPRIVLRPAPESAVPATSSHHPRRKGRTPIDESSLFSAPEPVLLHDKTESRPPTTNPFQAPEFEEFEEAAAEDSADAAPDSAGDGRLRDPFAPSA